jgi:hypothetical protein
MQNMWDFSDPVVFFAVFTVVFGVGMLVFLYFWVRRKMKVEPGPAESRGDNPQAVS